MLITNKISSIENNNKLIEKFVKLKIGKLFKSQKLAKLRKILSKNGNLSNFKAKKDGLSFLILDIKMIFNCL